MTDQADWSAPSTDVVLALMQAQLATLLTQTSPLNNNPTNSAPVVNGTRSTIVSVTGIHAIVLYNTDPVNTVYIGGSVVTASSGLHLLPGAYHSWLIKDIALYGITDGASVTLRMLNGQVT